MTQTRPTTAEQKWQRAVAAAAVSMVLLQVSVSDLLEDEDRLAVVSFYASGGLLMLAGWVGRWRGPVCSSAVSAAAVLLVPEEGVDAPPDPGSCDPFCAEPVPGLGWAVAAGGFAALLTAVGWLAAGTVGLLRR